MAKSGVTYVNPPSADPAQGMYSHVARMTPGEMAFIAGQVAIDSKGNPVGVGDVAAQVPVVFDNLGKILKDLGADFECVVQFTTYLTSADLHSGIHVGTRRFVSEDVPRWQVPAQHAAHRQSAGAARVPARGGGHRPTAELDRALSVGRRPSGIRLSEHQRSLANRLSATLRCCSQREGD